MLKRPYAEVIGDPIAHSKSPMIHNFWLNKLGIDAEYRACHVTRDNLGAYFESRRTDANWRGCNVTLPHKETSSSFAHHADEKAALIGATNCAYRDTKDNLVADNTDIMGVREAINGAELSGKNVCVIGCGGAARAAFTTLRGTQTRLKVLARDPRKAVRVSAECGNSAVGIPFSANSGALCEATLLINATQLGMTGQKPMPDFLLSELEELAADALVFDMVYQPIETALLKAARSRGLKTADGLTMLIGQAARAFQLFFGQAAPRQYDAELRDLLLR